MRKLVECGACVYWHRCRDGDGCPTAIGKCRQGPDQPYRGEADGCYSGEERDGERDE